MGLDNLDPVEITVRHDASTGLRQFVVELAYDAGLSPNPMRQLVCRILRVAPDPGNWSEWPNVAGEVEDLIARCKWYNVYDIIEGIYKKLKDGGYTVRDGEAEDPAQYFDGELILLR